MTEIPSHRSVRFARLVVAVALCVGCSSFPIESVKMVFAVHGPVDAGVLAARNDLSPALVLLSVGAAEGVTKGDAFFVFRRKCFVGKVVVEKVLDHVSGCRVLFTKEGFKIAPGDMAATRLQ